MHLVVSVHLFGCLALLSYLNRKRGLLLTFSHTVIIAKPVALKGSGTLLVRLYNGAHLVDFNVVMDHLLGDTKVQS